MPISGQTASADVNPSRFVKKTGAYTVAEAGATDVVFGVSQEGTKEAPIPGASALAASAGDPLLVYGEEEECLLEAGGAVADGTPVKPDANGRGVAAATGDRYYAIAERGADAAGEKMTVVVRFGVTP